jgi:ribosomal protein S18 acetylase RimI-like enzyme
VRRSLSCIRGAGPPRTISSNGRIFSAFQVQLVLTQHTSGFDVGLHARGATVRPLRADDRPQLEKLMRASPNFTQEEVETALEVIDEALAGDPEYIVNVVANDGIAGYECHGPTSLTDGTFDLYWIVVDTQAQKLGYGRLLLLAAEEDVARHGGRLLLIETSSQPTYDAAVRFYKRNGYRLEARIHDFYRKGDDKLVLAKDIAR